MDKVAHPPKNNGKARLVEGPVGQHLWKLSWPMTMGLFSVLAFNIVDTFYIGLLGADQLAAISFCFPVIFMMGGVAIGMGNGAVSLVARALGEGNPGRARRLTSNTMILVILYSLAMTFIMMTFSNYVFALLGTPVALMPYVNSYMDIWYAGLPFLILPVVGNSLIRANGEALAPSIFMVVAAIINAVLSPILMFGFLGAPEMGMPGAAWATLVARGSIAIVAIYYLGFRENMMEVSWRVVKAFPRHVGNILRYGAPATVSQLVAPVSTAFVVALLSRFGPEAVAGFTVGTRIEALAFIPLWAFQSGIGPFVGQNVGARKTERLASAEGWVWKFCLAYGLLIFILLTSFGGALTSAFTDDASIIALGDDYLMMLSAVFVFSGLFNVSGGVFNPLGYPMLGMGMSVLRHLVLFVGLSYLFVTTDILPGGENPESVFLAAMISWIIVGSLSGWLMHRFLQRPIFAKIADANLAAVALEEDVETQRPMVK